ncbi:hypothetical protein B0H34DRAFT_256149 [Crassisporium funariophilum]|nr:hypothetical protein B0H34DRAFT_256149 [Crassisporium funariophilum]
MSHEMWVQHDCMSDHGQAQNMTLDVTTSANESKRSDVFIAGAKHLTCRRVHIERDCLRSEIFLARAKYDFDSTYLRVVWTRPHQSEDRYSRVEDSIFISLASATLQCSKIVWGVHIVIPPYVPTCEMWERFGEWSGLLQIVVMSKSGLAPPFAELWPELGVQSGVQS